MRNTLIAAALSTIAAGAAITGGLTYHHLDTPEDTTVKACRHFTGHNGQPSYWACVPATNDHGQPTRIYEDGSAIYPDGATYDPDTNTITAHIQHA